MLLSFFLSLNLYSNTVLKVLYEAEKADRKDVISFVENCARYIDGYCYRYSMDDTNSSAEVLTAALDKGNIKVADFIKAKAFPDSCILKEVALNNCSYASFLNIKNCNIFPSDLILAAEHNCYNIVYEILERTTFSDDIMQKALDNAAVKKALEIVELLLSKGATASNDLINRLESCYYAKQGGVCPKIFDTLIYDHEESCSEE